MAYALDHLAEQLDAFSDCIFGQGAKADEESRAFRRVSVVKGGGSEPDTDACCSPRQLDVGHRCIKRQEQVEPSMAFSDRGPPSKDLGPTRQEGIPASSVEAAHPPDVALELTRTHELGKGCLLQQWSASVPE
jgi:hypothetical protein